ncbi:hypothetical protein [Methanovulcanius yangii]|uniref:hypothetical protein n=1 Tax=Methanovulcanius yangii TaxID=1789227 RepID=UPI0029C9F8D8|nr:hypothetical protein [Methanovulcanius yangii]
MKRNHPAFLSALLFIAMIPGVQALDSSHVYSTLSQNQYLTIAVAGLVLFAIFIAVLYMIGSRHAVRTKMNPTVRPIFGILAVMYLLTGTLLLFIAGIVLIEPFSDTAAFDEVVLNFQYYFPNIVFGIIATAAVGLILYLAGIYTIFMIKDTPEVKDLRTKDYHIQETGDIDEKTAIKQPYSNLSYRVLSWETGEPLVDGKVNLETTGGVLVMVKYTDFQGDVNFGKLKGTNDDYYPYVDGDKDRQDYRVIATIT